MTDLNGTGIVDAWVNIWDSEFWTETETDNTGYYTIIVKSGIFEFGVDPPENSTLGWYWEPSLIVQSDIVKNVSLTVELWIDTTGDDWLGFVTNGSVLTLDFEVNSDFGPVTDLEASMFKTWIHNWDDPTLNDVDPDNDWWNNQTENMYHTDVSDLTVYENNGDGPYTLTFTVDTSMAIFSVDGGFSIDVQISGKGCGWGFDVITGDVYIISGYVKDANSTSVEYAKVGLWNEDFWSGTKTNAEGYYTLGAPVGVYEFGVDSPENSTLSFFYDPIVDLNGTLIYNVTLSSGSSTWIIVNGTVKNSNSIPVENAIIELSGMDDDIFTVTDVSGYYSFNCSAGPYELIVETFDVNLSSYIHEGLFLTNDTTLDVILEIIVSPYTLTGSILDEENNPISGAIVILQADNYYYHGDANISGNYTVLVPAGTYGLLVEPPEESVFDDYYEPEIIITENDVRNFTLYS